LIPALEKPVSKIIMQHSALVDARFDLLTVEMRLFSSPRFHASGAATDN
jgi:hypothetical protein